jgi:hypothetical protein
MRHSLSTSRIDPVVAPAVAAAEVAIAVDDDDDGLAVDLPSDSSPGLAVDDDDDGLPVDLPSPARDDPSLNDAINGGDGGLDNLFGAQRQPSVGYTSDRPIPAKPSERPQVTALRSSSLPPQIPSLRLSSMKSVNGASAEDSPRSPRSPRGGASPRDGAELGNLSPRSPRDSLLVPRGWPPGEPVPVGWPPGAEPMPKGWPPGSKSATPRSCLSQTPRMSAASLAAVPKQPPKRPIVKRTATRRELTRVAPAAPYVCVMLPTAAGRRTPLNSLFGLQVSFKLEGEVQRGGKGGSPGRSSPEPAVVRQHSSPSVLMPTRDSLGREIIDIRELTQPPERSQSPSPPPVTLPPEPTLPRPLPMGMRAQSGSPRTPERSDSFFRKERLQRAQDSNSRRREEESQDGRYGGSSSNLNESEA